MPEINFSMISEQEPFKMQMIPFLEFNILLNRNEGKRLMHHTLAHETLIHTIQCKFKVKVSV